MSLLHTRNFLSLPARIACPSSLAVAAAALLAGCAGWPPAGSPPAAQAGPAPTPVFATPAASGASAAANASAPGAQVAARPPAPTPPGTPPAFAEVTRGAKSVEGYLTVWTRDDRTWLEIPAERLEQPMFLATSLASGLGEGYFLPGLMGDDTVVVLRRVGNTVQMVSRNVRARAPAGTPLARALSESFSDSLLAAAPLAAAPHPERKSLLIDANVFFGGDIAGLQAAVERTFRISYAMDRANSSIERTRTAASAFSLTMRSHFVVPKLPPPPSFGPGGPSNPAALPSPPRALPDARSFFVSVAYSLLPLPAEPMKPRRADQRVGFFTNAYTDFGNELDGDRRSHLAQRWRLEKQDPAAALSLPKEPIRVVMDRNIPLKWRETVRSGILEWNRAFERAGFKDALVVEQQPDDADWTVFEGARMLAVRWFAMEGPGALAVGPSQGDPRTGEILRASVIVPENWVRFDRNYVADLQPRPAPSAHGADAAAAAAAVLPAVPGPLASAGPVAFARRYAECSFATEALEHAAFGLELLHLRDQIAPDSEEATRFIAASLKAVVVHEVGHTLGLRHNFKASSGVTLAQLRDPVYTRENGISHSVMDYNPPNMPLAGEPVSSYYMGSLGAYDYWAIEWGYREFPAAEERDALARLAGRADLEPALAFGTDEDADNAEPTVNRFDLGDRPLAYAQHEFRLAREIWERTQARELAPTDTYQIYRRNLIRGLNRYAGSVPLLARYVGGAYTSRAMAGANKPLLTPVPAAEQREALSVLLAEVFSPASFRFEPRFMSRLGVDTFDRSARGSFGASTDFSLATAMLGIQRGALDVLMSDLTAIRLADAETKVDDRSTLLSYAEVQDKLRAAIWSEVALPPKADAAVPALPPARGADKAARAVAARAAPQPAAPAAPPAEIDTFRRNLQREHVRRLAAGVLRPASSVAADVRAVHRQVALELEAGLKAALDEKTWTPLARAHLADSLAMLSEALRAPLIKSGV